MPRYYIEVPHEPDKVSCLRAIKALLESGSHFLTKAEYGCQDGDHTARLIVELEDKDEALMVVPPFYRENTKIVRMSIFEKDKVDRMLEVHSKSDS